MPLSMHSASAPIFVRTLNNMSAWLDKAEQHATEKGFDPDNYLGGAKVLPHGKRQAQLVVEKWAHQC
jgi:hypothetical protein